MPDGAFCSLFFWEKNKQNRMLYPVRSAAAAIYIKEAAASEMAKNEKRPMYEPENFGLHIRAVILLEGGGFTLKRFANTEYAEI